MLNLNKIAENICKGNQPLVDFILKNEQSYKPVRAQVNSIARGLAHKYNDDKYISKTELHKLTWRIIDYAKGDVDKLLIEDF